MVMGRGLPAWHWAGPVLVLDPMKLAGPAWQGGRWHCRPLGVDTPAPSPSGLSLWMSVVKPSVSIPCLTHRAQRCARSRPQEVALCEGQGGPRRPELQPPVLWKVRCGTGLSSCGLSLPGRPLGAEGEG